MVTRRPRHLSSRPSEEAVSPFPRELDTPPVTKMNLLTPPAGRRRSSEMIGAPGHDNRTEPMAWWTLSSSQLGAGGPEELTGVGPSRLAVGMARQHAGNLDHPVLPGDGGGRGDGPAAAL